MGGEAGIQQGLLDRLRFRKALRLCKRDLPYSGDAARDRKVNDHSSPPDTRQEASAQFQPFRCLGEQLVGTGQSAFAAALLQRSKRLHHGRDAANGAGGGQLAAESESRDGSPCFLIIAL